MKRLAVTMFLSATALSVHAAPKLTPLMLEQGEVQIGAMTLYGEEVDGSNSWTALPLVNYGITDDVTIGLTGVRYRFYDAVEDGRGLEITTGVGLHGFYEINNEDDAFGYGADILARYRLDPKTALLGSLDYTFWGEEGRDNRSEYQTSIGFQRQLSVRISLAGSYTYHHLEDFSENHANTYNLGMNYHWSQQTNVGLVAGYSDFDPVKNGYTSDSSFEKLVGAYISYRF